MLSVDGTEIDAAAGTSGDGVVGAGNAAFTVFGVCDAVGVVAGDTTNGFVGAGVVSRVPKTNSSIMLRSRFPFLGAHDNAPVISANSRPYYFPDRPNPTRDRCLIGTAGDRNWHNQWLCGVAAQKRSPTRRQTSEHRNVLVARTNNLTAVFV